MKQDRQQQAEQLIASLELSLPPIAIAFRDAVPDGVPEFDGSVPAGCVFWQEAAKRTFATSAKHHALCSIGIHTLNLSQAPASQPEELRTTLEAMTGLDYVREEEVAAIPVVRRAVKHALYGPLADFPADPEVVLLFADARQGLVLSEAVGRVDGGVPPAMGRPACAVVPQTQHLAHMARRVLRRHPTPAESPTDRQKQMPVGGPCHPCGAGRRPIGIADKEIADFNQRRAIEPAAGEGHRRTVLGRLRIGEIHPTVLSKLRMERDIHQTRQRLPREHLRHTSERRGLEPTVSDDAKRTEPLRHQDAAVRQKGESPRIGEAVGHHAHADALSLGRAEVHGRIR